MDAKRNLCVSLACALLLVTAAAAQPGTGHLEGRVSRASGAGVGGVSVVLDPTGQAALTDSNGNYGFRAVRPGTYAVTFTLGENALTADGVVVEAGRTTTLDQTVDWRAGFADTITVTSASRRVERIVDAPAAVTVITEAEIEREVSHGQLPKLLEFSPGVQATQSGLYDYNFNTRGFNSSLNRRVQVLVDGRDTAVPFLAAQEWGIASQYLNDLASAELVRGPSSALYGKNAFNGVLNLVTKQPRYSRGGSLRISAGELSTFKTDFRWAGEVGSGWYAKVLANYLTGEDFSVDRNVTQEYAGLVREVIPRVTDENEYTFGALRLDKYLSGGSFFTLEGGWVDAGAPAIQTGIGRFALPSVERFWTRFNFTADHWNVLAFLNDRQGSEQTSLQSGAATYLDSQNYQIEVQTNWELAGGKVRVVAGASHREEEIDSANPQGRQTLIFAPVESDSQAAYAQVDFDIGSRVKLVLAGRVDESTLHDSQFSPKGSLVWSVNPNNTLRFTYNEAFQVGNYSELFLQADGAPPLNLQPFEGFCAAGGVSCGFAPGPTRILAVGNKNLEVEEIESFEIGYTGVLGGKALLTIDYYDNQLSNFITDLLPNFGTALGRLNPDFGPYQPPSGLGEPFRSLLLANLRMALGPSFFILSNNIDGTPALVAVSYTNFGQVDTEGADLGLQVSVTPEWRFHVNYSWFDFDIRQQLAGDPLVPNAPETSYGAGIAYVSEAFDFALNFRAVDEFPWSVGTLYRGIVPSYETVDLNTNFRFGGGWEVGVNVANLFEDEHYEAFGGDVLGRRAVGHIAYTW